MGEQTYACPCCGYLTMSEAPPGTFHICPVCFWEDDRVQFDDPDYAGGANAVSLREARANFRAIRASTPEDVANVRPPEPGEVPT